MNQRASASIKEILAQSSSLVLLAGLTYFILAAACLYLSEIYSHISIWIADAVLLTFIFRTRASLAWQYFAAGFFANLLAYTLFEYPLIATLGGTLSHSISILIPLLCITRNKDTAISISEINHQAYVIVASVVTGCLLAGLFHGLLMASIWKTEYIKASFSWFSINLLEMVSILSVGLTITHERMKQILQPNSIFEFMVVAAITSVITLLSTQHAVIRYIIIMLPLLYSAFRFGLFGTSALCLITAVTYVTNIALTGTPISSVSRLNPELISYSFFLMCLTFIPAIITAMLLEQRDNYEKKLSESEQLFRGSLIHSATGMGISSLEGRWMVVNPALCKITGYSEDELSKMTFLDITHDDDIDLDINLRQKLLRKEIPSYQLEKRYIRKNGSTVWVSVIVSAVYDKSSKPLYFFSQIENINTRKSMEAALQESEQRWNYALESGGQGVWDWDISKNRIYFSRKWKEILGFSNNDISNNISEWFSRIHSEDKAEVLSKIEELTSNKTTEFVCEHRLKCKDGTYKWVLGRGKVILSSSESKNALRAIGTCTDINSLKIAEAEAEKLSQRLLIAIESGKVGVWDLDLEKDYLIWDEHMFELYDIHPDTFTHNFQAWEKCIHPEDLQNTVKNYYQALAGLIPFDTEFRIIHSNGDIRWIHARAKVIRKSNGQAKSILGMNWDITEDKKLLQDLSTQREKLQTTLKAIGDAVIVTDNKGTITFFNPVAEQLIACKAEYATGKHLYEICQIVSESTGELLDNPIDACLKRKETLHFHEEAVLINQVGAHYYIQDSTAPIILPSGELTGCVLVMQDVTMNRNLQAELKHQATHDVLTGLINRREIERKVKQIIDTSRVTRDKHALLFIDLDHFKIVNDTAGHAAGDELLRRVAEILNQAVRSSDTVARLGGDEFAIMLPDCQPENAYDIANKIIDKVKHYSFHWDNKSYEIGASIGLVNFETHTLSLEEILSRADIACYSAKNTGGNHVSIYDEKSGEASEYMTEIKLFPEIKHALINSQFKLYTQKIVPLDQDISLRPYYEILLRMPNEHGDNILPGAIFKIAERHNLMSEIDLWVIRQILLNHADALLKADTIDVSINISPKSICDENFHRILDQYLSETEIPKDRIGFELREAAFLQDLETSQKFLRILEKHGCFVAMDNFGKGLSTFMHIKNFRKLYIKIDGRFINEMGSSTVDRAIVESINQLAHKLKAKTIAEKVESKEILKAAREIGIDYAQGYHVSKIIPLEDVLSKATQTAKTD